MTRILTITILRREKGRELPAERAIETVRQLDQRWDCAITPTTLVIGTSLQEFEANEKIWMMYVRELVDLLRESIGRFSASVEFTIKNRLEDTCESDTCVLSS